MFSHFPSAADFIFVASQLFGNIASTSYRMDNASGIHFVSPFGLASFGFGRGRKSKAHFALSLSHDFPCWRKALWLFSSAQLSLAPPSAPAEKLCDIWVQCIVDSVTNLAFFQPNFTFFRVKQRKTNSNKLVSGESSF